MAKSRKSYSSDVSNDEWALVAPYLTLSPEESGQRVHALREVFKWPALHRQDRRALASYAQRPAALGDRLSAGVPMAERGMLRGSGRGFAGHPAPGGGARRTPDRRHHRQPDPTFDAESGAHAAYDGAKRKKGSKLHLAVDTLGHLLALHVTPADADDRAEVGRIAKAIQAETGESVEIAFVDQGYTGEKPAAAAAEHGIALVRVTAPA